MVSRMARRAGDIVPGMERIDDVQLLCSTGMAAQALGVNLFRAGLCKKEQFGRIGRVCDVIGRRTVAGLAALPGRASARVVRSCPMAGFLPAFVFGRVTILAGFGAGVARTCCSLARRVLLSSKGKYRQAKERNQKRPRLQFSKIHSTHPCRKFQICRRLFWMSSVRSSVIHITTSCEHSLKRQTAG